MPVPLSTDAKVVVGAFLASGVVHLVKPEVYEPLMPSWVPQHRRVIVGSGVAELACAVGLLVPRTRRTAGLASVALLLGVEVPVYLRQYRRRRPHRPRRRGSPACEVRGAA